MSHNDYNAGLPLWTVASKYLNLVARVASKIAEHGNSSVALSTRPLTPDEIAAQTQWSDSELSVPLIFDFYHGLEVMMKGFLVAAGQPAKGHELSKLLKKVEAIHADEAVFQLMSSYIKPTELNSPLKEFFADNHLTPDSFHEAFKYPETMKGKSISHTKLKYGGSARAEFYYQLATDAERVSKQSARLTHSWKTASA